MTITDDTKVKLTFNCGANVFSTQTTMKTYEDTISYIDKYYRSWFMKKPTIVFEPGDNGASFVLVIPHIRGIFCEFID